MKKLLLYIVLVAVSFSFAQQTPAPEQKEAFTIVGATAHIGDGTVVENSIIIVENGKISTCVDGTVSKIAYKGKIIEAKNMHVYPGFVAPNTTLGLQEIGSVRATNDTDEIGQMLPHIRSLIAYNAESKIVESMRPNGVLVAQTAPRGGTISGTSSIVQLDAWNWEDAALKADDGIHMNWPNSFTRGRWWLGEDPGWKANKNYAKNVTNIGNYVAESKSYLAGDRTEHNLPFDAMEGLFDGNKKLYVHVNDEKGITDAIGFKNQYGIKHMVVVGGYEAHKAADLLVKNSVAVLAQRTHKTPWFDDEDYDYPYKMAKLLVDKGVLVGLESSGQMERMNTRNLPFYAGTVAAHGLDKEEALKLITHNNAKILGIDNMVGTLAPGKDATLFISKGDALDMRGNMLTHAFINGRALSLETHQTKLWQRYNKKINGQ